MIMNLEHDDENDDDNIYLISEYIAIIIIIFRLFLLNINPLQIILFTWNLCKPDELNQSKIIEEIRE